jgi:hypothetical protein
MMAFCMIDPSGVEANAGSSIQMLGGLFGCGIPRACGITSSKKEVAQSCAKSANGRAGSATAV